MFNAPALDRPQLLPVLQHGCRALHDVRHARHDEPPPGDQLQRVREAGTQPELNVLHQDLFEDLEKDQTEDVSMYRVAHI